MCIFEFYTSFWGEMKNRIHHENVHNLYVIMAQKIFEKKCYTKKLSFFGPKVDFRPVSFRPPESCTKLFEGMYALYIICT